MWTHQPPDSPIGIRFVNTLRRFFPLATTLVVAVLFSCVDGRSPTSLDSPGTASFTIIPRYAPGPQAADGAAPINRIRVTARLVPDGTVLATFTQDVDPPASAWDLAIEVPIPSGGGSAILSIELLNVGTGGTETVEWSGATPPVPRTPGQPFEAKEAQVYRGPADNLAGVGITVTPDSARIAEGDSVQLRAALTTTSTSASPRVFWASLDTAVASVSATGMVRARLPGTARIVGYSGRPADTVRVVVTAIPRAVTISPTSVTLTAPGQETTFTAQVLDARGAPIAGQQVTWRSLAPTIVESLGGGRFRARLKGQAQVQARAVSDTTLAATATVRADFPQADLALDKRSGVTQVPLGDTVAFTVAVTNEGPDAAGAFAVRDVPPAGMTYVTGSASSGQVKADSLLWRVPGLGAGATVSWRLVFRVNTAAEPLASNSARITEATTFDPNAANDSDTHQIGIARDADVGVSLTATPNPVVRGDTLSLRARVATAGPARAVGVRVAVPIPAGLDAQSTHTATGSFDAATGVWTVGDLAAGASAELVHRATVRSGAPDSITAEAAWRRFAPATDPDTTDNVARATVRVVSNELDLALMKGFSRSVARELDTLRWTVTLVNRGPGPARAVRIADSLDASGFQSVTVVSSRRMTSLTPGGSQDILAVDSLPAGDTAWIEFQGVVRPGAAGRQLWNRAHVASVSPLLVLTSTSDDAASASLLVRSNSADLQVRKTVSKDIAFPGDTLVYQVQVVNRGPIAVSSFGLEESMDTGALTDVKVAHNVRISGPVPGVLAGTSLAPGDTAILIVTAVVPITSGDALIRNRARLVSVSGAVDTFTANDADSVQTRVEARRADLALTKTVSRDSVLAGDSLTWEVRLVNLGPHVAGRIEVMDALDAARFTSLSVIYRSRFSGSVPGTLVVDSLRPGDTAVVRVRAVTDRAVSGVSVPNRVWVSSLADARDPVSSNDAASASVYVRATADLRLTKGASRSTMVAGDTVQYVVQLENLGPHTARMVQVEDTLPLTLGYASVSTTIGSLAETTWMVDSIAVGQIHTLTARMLATAATPLGVLENRAKIVSTGTAVDLVTTNNAASVTVNVQGVDLRVTKISSNPAPAENQAFTYAVAVKNLGTATATGITVKDPLPSGMVYVSHGGSGTYDPSPSVATWSIDMMGPGDSVGLSITVRPANGTAGTIVENRAWLTAVTPVDLSAANDTAKVPLTIASPDMFEVIKTSSNPSPLEDQAFSYRVRIRNVGPSLLTNVRVSDTIPAGIVSLTRTLVRSEGPT
ncbi:MAG: DUF11 domain-containing protein, partial [Gemmatimonadetes bacterium]|nr:DUF11 domain-containing protein [Gemmatimonadota bacterium]